VLHADDGEDLAAAQIGGSARGHHSLETMTERVGHSVARVT
jgi:hypothetical protein